MKSWPMTMFTLVSYLCIACTLASQELHPHHHHHLDSVQSESESADDLEEASVVSLADVSPEAFKKVDLRPGAGGEADVVNFGLYAKTFYGTDLKANTFRADIVMSFRWKDTRAVSLIPAGLPRVVLSGAAAKSKLWQPDIIITNHAIKGYEVISSNVQVLKSGTVEKVERAQVMINNNFELGNYPFDVQELRIKIASAKYMSDDLVLVPMEGTGSSGLRDGVFDHSLYIMNSWATNVHEEADGDLVKSRGMLDLVVYRRLDKYTQDHLVPTAIILMISWGVFFFPFEKAFCTPRLVLSIVALLTFTNIMIKSSSLLPGAAPYNWNDLLNQVIQILIFNGVLKNLVSEACAHHFELEELSRAINHEAKFVQPALSIVIVTMIMVMGSYHMLSLVWATRLTQVAIVGFLCSYGYFTWRRFRVHHRAKKLSDSARSSPRSPRP